MTLAFQMPYDRGVKDLSWGCNVQRRNTRQRQLVLDTVRELHDHPTADEVYQFARKKDGKISRATVYRNLSLLCDTGQLLSIRVPGSKRFDDTLEPHSHLVCRECGSIVDVPLSYDRELDRAVESKSSYTDVNHATVFYGLCPSCRRKLPLA